MNIDAKVLQKYAKYDLPKLKKKAQEKVNKFVRMRDRDGDYFVCIACSKTKHVSQMDAGHYLPAGQYSRARYEEDCLNGECRACNFYSGDHLIGYRKNLIAKIGIERVEALEAMPKMYKWDRIELILIIEKYK